MELGRSSDGKVVDARPAGVGTGSDDTERSTPWKTIKKARHGSPSNATSNAAAPTVAGFLYSVATVPAAAVQDWFAGFTLPPAESALLASISSIGAASSSSSGVATNSFVDAFFEAVSISDDNYDMAPVLIFTAPAGTGLPMAADSFSFDTWDSNPPPAAQPSSAGTSSPMAADSFDSVGGNQQPAAQPSSAGTSSPMAADSFDSVDGNQPPAAQPFGLEDNFSAHPPPPLPVAPRPEPLDALCKVLGGKSMDADQFIYDLLESDYVTSRVSSAADSIIRLALKPPAEFWEEYYILTTHGADAFVGKYGRLPAELVQMSTSLPPELIEKTKDPSHQLGLFLCSVKYPLGSEEATHGSLAPFVRMGNQLLGGEGSVYVVDLSSICIHGPHFGIASVGQRQRGSRGTYSIAHFAHKYVGLMALTLSMLLILSKGRNHFFAPAEDGAEDGAVVEPMRIAYQDTLFKALMEGGYSKLVNAVLEHFSSGLGLSRGTAHLYRSFTMGDQLTLLELLAFLTGQLNLDQDLLRIYIAAAKQVMAEASTRLEYSPSEHVSEQPGQVFGVSMHDHLLQSRSHAVGMLLARVNQGDLDAVLAHLATWEEEEEVEEVE